MSGITVFGDVPHTTEIGKAHRSLGEPLDHFASIKFRGKKGPQATDLARMHMAYYVIETATMHAHGMSREMIEKRFGPGKLRDPKMTNGPKEYSLQGGQFMVYWDGEGERVSFIDVLHGKNLPTAKGDEPEKLAKQARELANADRAIVHEYFSKMRDTMTPEEYKWVCELLNQSQKQLQWTAGERRLMLGNKNE